MKLASLVLLADVEKLSSLSRRFRRGGSSLGWSELLLFAAVLVGVVIVAAVISHRIAQREKPGYRHPRRLFNDLCKAHGLDRAKRQLLLSLAKHQRLAHPSRLFLEPERFDAANLSPALSDRQRELQRVRDMMFGKRLKVAGSR